MPTAEGKELSINLCSLMQSRGEIQDTDPQVKASHLDFFSPKDIFHQLIGNEISPSAVLAGAKLTGGVATHGCPFPAPAATIAKVCEVQLTSANTK